MLKILLGIAIGYAFSDLIDEMINSVTIGAHQANQKSHQEPS